ncbi:MAG: cation diffusion facilitator family transporter [Eubacteriales bacterium]|nr:cation diffusion facilitator family transporter [Eubacteriales bacterium]
MRCVMEEKKIVRKLSLIGIGGNILLVAFKLYAGIAGKSGAMLSDAIHSLSDVFATLIAFLGVRMANKAPDSEHPYGHDRFECLASLTLGLILAGTGIGIGASGIRTIAAGNYAALEIPKGIALAAAVVSIVVKEGMFRYTKYYAVKLNSSAFMADAWHHRSDALSSVGSLAGIGGAMLGYPVLDSAASVIICMCILKVAYDILKDALKKLLDTSCDKALVDELKVFITAQEGVDALDILHTRQFGDKIYIDAEISVDGNMTLREAHAIAERVHDAVERKYPNTKHIMIHENPTEK